MCIQNELENEKGFVNTSIFDRFPVNILYNDEMKIIGNFKGMVKVHPVDMPLTEKELSEWDSMKKKILKNEECTVRL